MEPRFFRGFFLMEHKFFVVWTGFFGWSLDFFAAVFFWLEPRFFLLEPRYFFGLESRFVWLEPRFGKQEPSFFCWRRIFYIYLFTFYSLQQSFLRQHWHLGCLKIYFILRNMSYNEWQTAGKLSKYLENPIRKFYPKIQYCGFGSDHRFLHNFGGHIAIKC